MTRATLPARRPNATHHAEHNGKAISITVGYDLTGRPMEVFADGHREGSDMRALMSDACVVISIALQRGATPEELAHSLGTVPAYENGEHVQAHASLIGVIVAALKAT